MSLITIDDILQLAPPFFLGMDYGDYPDFYNEMATGMNEMVTSINSNLDGLNRCIELLDYLTNLTTSVDYDVVSAVLTVRLALGDGVYNGLMVNAISESEIYVGVKTVNDYTKRYIYPDLTFYVNNAVWPEGCVPYEWARISEITGEDISGWNICDPS